jgi:hypothetical protein
MRDCIQVDRIIGLDGNASPPVSIFIDESGLISGVEARGSEPVDCVAGPQFAADTQKISEIWFEGELLTQ